MLMIDLSFIDESRHVQRAFTVLSLIQNVVHLTPFIEVQARQNTLLTDLSLTQYGIHCSR